MRRENSYAKEQLKHDNYLDIKRTIPGKTRPEKAFTFSRTITKYDLRKLSEYLGTEGTANRRAKTIKREREQYQLFVDQKKANKEAKLA